MFPKRNWQVRKTSEIYHTRTSVPIDCHSQTTIHKRAIGAHP